MLTLLSRSSVLLKVARPKLELSWCLLELPSSPPNVLSASLKFSLVLIKPLAFLQLESTKFSNVIVKTAKITMMLLRTKLTCKQREQPFLSLFSLTFSS